MAVFPSKYAMPQHSTPFEMNTILLNSMRLEGYITTGFNACLPCTASDDTANSDRSLLVLKSSSTSLLNLKGSVCLSIHNDGPYVILMHRGQQGGKKVKLKEVKYNKRSFKIVMNNNSI